MTSMTISELELYWVQIGCMGQQSPVWSLVVRLATDSGLEGWGEGQVVWRPAELGARRDFLLPVLAGRSAFDIEEFLTLEALRLAPLRCAVEMALWDLVGRAARQPICHLLGGAYRQRVALAVRLPAAPAQQAAQVGRELADKGFHTQIIASTGQLELDLETVAAVREVAHERAELRFDAAGNYDLDRARELCTELEDQGLQFVLDPLREPKLDQIASLRRQTSVPLAVSRAIRSPADMLAVVRCGAAASVIVDLQSVGGIQTARKCAAIAEAAGIPASLGCGPSLGIAAAAALQLVASSPGLSNCHDYACHQLQEDLLVEPLEIVDGMIAVPRGPGLGVEIDRAKVEHYQVT